MKSILLLLLFFISFQYGTAQTLYATQISGSLLNKQSSCAVKYNDEELVALHNQISCGTVVQIENQENGLKVDVKIIGKTTQKIAGVSFEISKKAAEKLQMKEAKSIKIDYKILKNESAVAKDRFYKKTKEVNEIKPSALYQIAMLEVQTNGYGVQIAGYSDLEVAMEQMEVMKKNWKEPLLIYSSSLSGKNYYKLILGIFENKNQADELAELLKQKFKMKDAFTVDYKNLK